MSIEFESSQTDKEHQQVFERYLKDKDPGLAAILLSALEALSAQPQDDAGRRLWRDKSNVAIRGALDAMESAK